MERDHRRVQDAEEDLKIRGPGDFAGFGNPHPGSRLRRPGPDAGMSDGKGDRRELRRKDPELTSSAMKGSGGSSHGGRLHRAWINPFISLFFFTLYHFRRKISLDMVNIGW
jgi:hypothetical protein